MTTKTVYQTNQLGLYVGPVEADESPLEPGVFLLPGGCVSEPPPLAPKHKAAHWNGKGWALVDYLDGVIVYHTETRDPMALNGAAAVPAGYTLKRPAPNQIWKKGRWVDDLETILAKLQSMQQEAVTTGCANYIVSGFTSDALGASHNYDSSLEDQVNLVSAVLSGLDGLCSYTDADGQKKLRPHTAAQLQTVSQHFAAFRQAALQQAEQLKDAIAQLVAVKDVKALESITWAPPL